MTHSLLALSYELKHGNFLKYRKSSFVCNTVHIKNISGPFHHELFYLWAQLLFCKVGIRGQKGPEKRLHSLWTPLLYFIRKKCEKVCTEKKYTHIFCPSLDSNPRTSKMIQFCGLAPKLTQPPSFVRNWAMIISVIQRNFFRQISNYWCRMVHALFPIWLC